MLILETFWRRTSCRACHRAVSYFPMYQINNRTQLAVTLTTGLDDLLIGLHIRTRRRMLHIRNLLIQSFPFGNQVNLLA